MLFKNSAHEILCSFNRELQFKKTESALKNKLKNLFNKLKGFEFVMALVSKFKKTINEDETKYSVFYSNSKVETIIQYSGIDNVLE